MRTILVLRGGALGDFLVTLPALALLRAGKRASYAELATDLGHDSFLLESEDLYALVRAFLEREGAELMLEEPRGRTFLAGALEHPYGRGMNLQTHVDDVDALHAAVLAAGLVPLLALEETPRFREALSLLREINAPAGGGTQ